MKAQLVSMSPGLPREDLARHQIGSVDASRRAAETVLPGRVGVQLEDGNLNDDCYPRSAVYAGTFGETFIVASSEDSLLNWTPPPAQPHRNAVRVIMHSVVSTAGFTFWGADGSYRDFAGSWEDGALSNEGDILPFESSFWTGAKDPDGEARALHGSDMPFSPMSLGEEALREFFGFVGEGEPEPTDLDAFDIVLHGFAVIEKKATIKLPSPVGQSTGFMSRLFNRNRRP